MALVGRFGTGSHLSRVPNPDQGELREMVIAAFTSRSRDELNKLAADIAAAQRDAASEATLKARHRCSPTNQRPARQPLRRSRIMTDRKPDELALAEYTKIRT